MMSALRMSRPSSVRRRGFGPAGRMSCPGRRRLSRVSTGREPTATGLALGGWSRSEAAGRDQRGPRSERSKELSYARSS